MIPLGSRSALLALVVFAATAAPLMGQDPAAIDRVLREHGQSEPSELGRRLADLGPEFIDGLFARLVTAESTGSEASILRALELQPGSALRDFLASLAAEPTDSESLRTAMGVLEELGDRADIDLLARLATPAGEVPLQRSLRMAFGRALDAILDRDPRAVQVLAHAYRGLHASLLYPAVQSIARQGNATDLRLLTDLLGRVAGADALVLTEVARLGAGLRGAIDEDVRAEVRGYLDSDDRVILTAAVRAAAAFEDPDAALDLIRLLEHELPGVRSAALDGLRAISGKRFGRDARRWRAWHEGEMRWWNERFGTLAEALQTGVRHEVSEAIGEFSKRRFFRHELAAPLSRCLMRDEADLVLMSCAALGHLRSERAVPALKSLLGHPDQSIVEAAERALRAIGGVMSPYSAAATHG